MLSCRHPRQNEYTSSYDTADAKHDEIERPENLCQVRAVGAREALHLQASSMHRHEATVEHNPGLELTCRARLLSYAASPEGTAHEQIHEAIHQTYAANAACHAGRGSCPPLLTAPWTPKLFSLTQCIQRGALQQSDAGGSDAWPRA